MGGDGDIGWNSRRDSTVIGRRQTEIACNFYLEKIKAEIACNVYLNLVIIKAEMALNFYLNLGKT